MYYSNYTIQHECMHMIYVLHVNNLTIDSMNTYTIVFAGNVLHWSEDVDVE